MNSKKLITLLVLTTLLFAMVPPFANAVLSSTNIDITNLDKGALVDSGEKGHDISLEGDAGAVASGYEVLIYWDKIQAWDGEQGHLNTTEVDNDGGFEIWFTVPQAKQGNHYVWFTATDQETKVSVTFAVVSDCDISTSSGLSGSKVYVDLWGYAKSKEVAILFIEEGTTPDEPAADWNDVDEAEDSWAATATATYSGLHLTYAPVYAPAADALEVEVDTVLQGTYDTTNGWQAVAGGDPIAPGSCSINLATGVVTIVFATALTGDETIDIIYDAGHFTETAEDLDTTYDADEDEYDDTLDNGMIEPGTFVLHIGAELLDDDDGGAIADPVGDIYDDNGLDVGSINYVSGDWSINLKDSTNTYSIAFTADYEYYDDIDNHCYVITTSGMTNTLGTWENRRITIPDDALENEYYVVGMDGKDNEAYDDFEIGAVITVSTDMGDVGDKVEVEGEGFPASVELECHVIRGSKIEQAHIVGSEDTTARDDDETNVDGEFAFEMIIPQVDKKDDDFEIRVREVGGGGVEASTEFEVTGLASVSVEPDFGPQGSKVVVSGQNYQNIKDKKVKIMLYETDSTTWVADIKDDVKVDSDGSFEVTCTIPTENDDSYKVLVQAKDDDGAFNIKDTVDFRIGTILILLSDDEGVVGEKIVLTGNGFTDNGEWNATFGDVTIFSEEQASLTGLLRVGTDTPEFFVPQLQPGVYSILVWDVDAEISVETEFTVTEYTVLEFELLEAPNEFNVSIDGWNWPEVDGVLNSEDEIKFVLWNETDEWEMDVRQMDGTHTQTDLKAALNATGFYNEAWWVVPDEDTLSKGSYYINATIEADNDQEYFMQLEFVIGDVHVYSAPRKATFRIGDTVSFKIQHTFGNDANQQIKSGDIKVYDPDDELYWDGDQLNTWSKVETWYESPTSSQTASGNPMVLLDDAPLGTWSYKWREKDGDTIKEGTFNVEASSADIIGEQIEDLNSAIDDLTSDISSVTDAVAGVQNNINSAIQAANAAVDAANLAVEAVNAVASTAGEAATAAQQAADAASDAKDAASGLTTLVYGAIGASLVAALAAIVSLMQISRRIAG